MCVWVGRCVCMFVNICFVDVQSLSWVWLFATPWTAECQVSLSFTISQRLFRLMFTESMMPCNHLILCHSLLFLSSVFPSIRVSSNELALCIMWPKYWSFSFSPSNEYSGWFSIGNIYIYIYIYIMAHKFKYKTKYSKAFSYKDGINSLWHRTKWIILRHNNKSMILLTWDE